LFTAGQKRQVLGEKMRDELEADSSARTGVVIRDTVLQSPLRTESGFCAVWQP